MGSSELIRAFAPWEIASREGSAYTSRQTAQRVEAHAPSIKPQDTDTEVIVFEAQVPMTNQDE